MLQAKDTEKRCRRLLALRRDTLEKITHIKGSNRLAPIVDRLFGNPVLTIPWVARQFGVAYATARADVEKLVGIGLLVEAPEQSQPKAYYAQGVLRSLRGELGTVLYRFGTVMEGIYLIPSGCSPTRRRIIPPAVVLSSTAHVVLQNLVPEGLPKLPT